MESTILIDLTNRLASVERLLQSLVKQQTIQEWYSTAEVAERLGKAEFTVREWCRLKRIFSRKRNSGRGPHAAWVISHQELDRLQREGLLPVR